MPINRAAVLEGEDEEEDIVYQELRENIRDLTKKLEQTKEQQEIIYKQNMEYMRAYTKVTEELKRLKKKLADQSRY